VDDEYDFTGAERGKFYRKGAVFTVIRKPTPLPDDREQTLASAKRDDAPSTKRKKT
jgi:hypothetical protein